jgi:[ribosomal protein S5]-alanine N-acetyltransferase
VADTLERGDRIDLRQLHAQHKDAFLSMVASSRDFHRPWTSPPTDERGFQQLLVRTESDDFRSLVGWRRDDNALVGVVNLSQIVRGYFHCCYCGFYGNAATAGQGLMRETLELTLRYVFLTEALHRIEANVQPDNARSLALLRRVGFRHEGFSPRYLQVNGQWHDHERFAMTIEDWIERGQSSC